MTMRLSHSSLTGTERTLVAVGTVRLASMLAAVRAGAPRSTVYVGSAAAADSCSLAASSFALLLLVVAGLRSPFGSDFCWVTGVLFRSDVGWLFFSAVCWGAFSAFFSGFSAV